MKMFFDYAEADKIRRRKVCGVCFGELLIQQNEDRSYSLKCINHGILTDNLMVHRSRADKIQGDVSAASLELRQEERKNQPRRSEADILSELGFE